MRVVVTGARGRVGQAAVDALARANHEVIATDVQRPSLELRRPEEATYINADLRAIGEAFAIISRVDAVVHLAAIPTPTVFTPQAVFETNVLTTYNCVEAAIRAGVPRFVCMSSEATLGFQMAVTPALPDYLPVDEDHPMRPQDTYSLSKVVGEEILDAAVRATGMSGVSLRSSWVQFEQNIETNIGPLVADPTSTCLNYHSYTDIYDLADAIVLAVQAETVGHEVVFAAQPDNIGGRDFERLIRDTYSLDVPLRPLERPDSSGVSSRKACQLLGWEPTRSWRDYLDDSGHLNPSVREKYLSHGGVIRRGGA